MTWPMFELGRVAKIVGGSTPRRERPEYWGGGIPWLTPTDLPMPGAGIQDVTETESTITEKGLASCSANLLPVGAVMFSSRATIGKLGIARTPVATNQGFANFIPGPAVDSKYLAYCLLHRTEQITGLAGSTTFKEVTKTALKKVEIPLPALSEQRLIVETLDQADALREQRRAADARAQAILPALFYKIIGDPVSNPKGWPVVELRELGSPLSGGAFPRDAQGHDAGEVPFVKVSDMNTVGNEIYIKQSNNWVSRETLGRLRVKTAPLGTTVFPKIGAAVATNKKRLLLRDTAYDNNVIGVVPRHPDWSLYIFAFFLLFDLARLTRTTAVPSIKTSELAALPLPKPDGDAIRAFNVAFEQLLGTLAAQRRVRKRIDRLFDVLLHRAFTGELTAGWREEHRDQLEAEMQEQLEALEAAAAEKPKRGRRARASESSGRADGARNAGHDMFNKAALVTYIVAKCHDPSRPLGRTKLAKLFYLVQRRAEISLTEQFARRAAGPIDDAIPKVLSLARKNGWVTLAKAQGKLKPVVPGENPQPAIDHVKQRWAEGLTVIDDALDTMKGWGWEALERWATVENAAQQLATDGKPATLDAIKTVIASEPKWKPKLERDAFSDLNIQRTLKGLRDHGYLPAEAGANH